MTAAGSERWTVVVLIAVLVLAPATASVGAAEGHGTSIPVNDSDAAPAPENVTVREGAAQEVVGDGDGEALVFDSGGTAVDFASDCGYLHISLDVGELPPDALTDETEVEVELADDGGFLGGLLGGDDQFGVRETSVNREDLRAEFVVEVAGCEEGNASAVAVDSIELTGLDLSGATPGAASYRTGAYFVNSSEGEEPDAFGGGDFDEALAGDAYELASFQIVDATDPEADAGDDRTVEAGQTVTLDGSNSSDDTAIDSYRWDVDGDGAYELNGSSPTHAFEAPGKYRVELVVTDTSDNTDADSVTVAVEEADANEPPTVGPIEDRALAEDETETVEVTASDPDGDPIDLALADGPAFASVEDGGNGTGTLTLAPGPGDAGEHAVTVAATDGDSTANASLTVTVSDTGESDDDGAGDDDGDGADADDGDEGSDGGDGGAGDDGASGGDGGDGASSGDSSAGVSGSSSGGGGSAVGSGDGEPDPGVRTARESPNVVLVEVTDVRADEPLTVRLPDFEGEAGAGTQLAGFVLRPSAIDDVELLIERTDTPPGETPGLGDDEAELAYFTVDHSVPDEDVSSVTVGFRVEKSRLDDAGADPGSVTVYRYEDGGWASYDAGQVDEDADAYYYTADVPGFSRFAVGAEPAATEEGATDADTATENSAAGETEQPSTAGTPAGGPVESEGGFDLGAVALLGGLVALFVVGYFGGGPLYERFRRP